MNVVKVKSYAKLNLTLEILGVEKGYHLLDSLVTSVDIYDLIVLKKRKDKFSRVVMHGMNSESIPPEKNNALKAAERFSERFGTLGADITVYKNIPIGAGLGGSSADISGVINGMAKLYGVADFAALKTLADELGSDTGYMLTGGFARMCGRGEIVQPLRADATLNFLLLCPQSSVATGACFQAYDQGFAGQGLEKTTEKCMRALLENDKEGVGRYLTNDLLAPAKSLNRDIERALEEAQAFSPLGVGMSGSGSCVFALFESKEFCEWAKSRYRGKCRAIVAQSVQNKKNSVFKNPFTLTEGEALRR